MFNCLGIHYREASKQFFNLEIFENNMDVSDDELQKVRDRLEFLMMQLPTDLKSNRLYLSGYIDALFDTKQVTDNQRQTLQLEYVD